MARYRTIKPEFWTSEQVVDVSPTARLLFIGLWNFCDDGGVHPYSLKRIKMEVFPADVIEVSPLIKELIDVELLQDYTVDGERFLYVTGWHHQRIEKPRFQYPRPPNGDAPAEDASIGGGEILRPVGDASKNGRRPLAPEGKGSEGKGSEGKGSEGKGSEGKGEEGNGNEREGRGVRRSLVDLSEIDWDEVTRCACFIHSKVPIRNKQNALAWCRIAVLLQTTFAEDWLQDALHAVKIQKPSDPQGYLVGTLKSKATERGVEDLIGLMKHVRIRDDVLAEVLDAKT